MAEHWLPTCCLCKSPALSRAEGGGKKQKQADKQTNKKRKMKKLSMFLYMARIATEEKLHI